LIDSLEKIAKSIRGELASRYSNQFIVSFYFAFVAINWEVFLLLFAGDVDSEKKIPLILSKFHYLKLVVFPLLIAIVYVLAAPATMYLSNLIWSFISQKINAVSRRFDEKKYLTIDNSLRITSELYEFDQKYKDVLSENREAAEKYRNEISEANLREAALQKREAEISAEVSALRIEKQSLFIENQQLKDDIRGNQIAKDNLLSVQDENQEALKDFLSETTWELAFSNGRVSSTERLVIRSGWIYYIRNHPTIQNRAETEAATFILKSLRFDRSKKEFTWVKWRIQNSQKHSLESLRVLDQNTIEGSDDLGYRLTYKRIGKIDSTKTSTKVFEIL